MSELRDAILEKLKVGGISFVDLEQVAGFSGGHLAPFVPNYPNIILWQSVSAEALEILNQARHDGLCHMQPTTRLVYLTDGKLLNLPIAKQIRNYKKLHWLPIVFNPGRLEAHP